VWRAAKKKKPVITVSTECSAASIDVQSRATNKLSSKPLVVHEHNLSINGVDKADQYTIYYSFICRSKSGGGSSFFWLLEVAVVNSYILYRICTPRPALTHLQYRRNLVEVLATQHIRNEPPHPLVGRPRAHPLFPTGNDPERLNKRPHFLGKRNPQDCVVCSDHPAGKRHRSAHKFQELNSCIKLDHIVAFRPVCCCCSCCYVPRTHS